MVCVVLIRDIGAPTYLVSPVDFATNPQSLFLTLSRYKIKDTYATGQMLDYAMSAMQGKGFALHELKNMMISTDSRPRVDLCKRKQLIHRKVALLTAMAQSKRFAYTLQQLVWIELPSIPFIPTS